VEGGECVTGFDWGDKIYWVPDFDWPCPLGDGLAGQAGESGKIKEGFYIYPAQADLIGLSITQGFKNRGD
jgi:hypothetical protein